MPTIAVEILTVLQGTICRVMISIQAKRISTQQNCRSKVHDYVHMGATKHK